MTTWCVAAGMVTVAMVAVIAWKRRNDRLPATMFAQTDQAIRTIQRSALRTILPRSREGDPPDIDEERMRQCVTTVHRVIRFAYTIEEHPKGFLHTLSSQLIRPKPGKYHVQCMLTAMMVLYRELEESGIRQSEVTIELSESDEGTHYLGMLLNPRQHDWLAVRLLTPRASAKAG